MLVLNAPGTSSPAGYGRRRQDLRAAHARSGAAARRASRCTYGSPRYCRWRRAQRVLAPLRAVAPTLLDTITELRYHEAAEELRAVYGHERYDRLAAIKKRHDPHNLFRMNHNITPTA
ncbi:MAG TPA: BBE domain-containing protein [Actinoallomurus sp.]|jgi:hypothetical protein|nr:BBE domain-containing protein [Actinoallomurus sp.]